MEIRAAVQADRLQETSVISRVHAEIQPGQGTPVAWPREPNMRHLARPWAWRGTCAGIPACRNELWEVKPRLLRRDLGSTNGSWIVGRGRICAENVEMEVPRVAQSEFCFRLISLVRSCAVEMSFPWGLTLPRGKQAGQVSCQFEKFCFLHIVTIHMKARATTTTASCIGWRCACHGATACRAELNKR